MVGGCHDEKKLLADAYHNSFELAVSHSIKSIAFPAISTGAYRFPFETAASIALTTAKDFISMHPDALERVVFVLFSAGDYNTYMRLCRQFFSESSPGIFVNND